jgi:hypothetical protein
MIRWTLKTLSILGVSVALLLGLGFGLTGKNVFGYLRSSSNMIQKSVKDAMPVELDLQRARDLLGDLVPEIKNNLSEVVSEEVEVAELEQELVDQREAIESERARVRKIRTSLSQSQVSYQFSSHTYTRGEVVNELKRRFEQLKTAEMLVEGKERLLTKRRQSLAAAQKKLEKTRLARIDLDAQIESLEAQFRLIQAQSSTSNLQFDASKLTELQGVIKDLKKRLQVAERVLARDAEFIEVIPVETESEASIMDSVDAYLNGDLVEKVEVQVVDEF